MCDIIKLEVRGEYKDMDDKVFEFMEKMYSDLKNEIKGLGTKMEGEIKTLSDNVEILGNHATRLENKLDSNSKALFDGYNQVYEKLQEHDKRFDGIESKLDNINSKIEKQEVEIKVIKGGRQT